MLPLVLAALTFSVSAAPISDSDLTGREVTVMNDKLEREGKASWSRFAFPLRLRTPSSASDGRVSATVLLLDPAGHSLPARLATATLVGPDDAEVLSAPVAEDGSWSAAIPAGAKGEHRVRVTLDNARWSFVKPGWKSRAYVWESAAFTLPAPGVALGALQPEAGTENAKLGFIHLTYVGALDALARHGVDAAWWTENLEVYWPDSSDYFSPWGFDLHLTRGEAWDVNLHELGHAVAHAAGIVQAAGGQHKIDECYSAGLAWSEGWASFFAAAMRLDPADPDARFEFLVPRRAPIRVENVPADVCEGETNEWRVTAALWDLFDSNADGADASTLPLARLWKSWAGKKLGALTSYFRGLDATLSPAESSAAAAALAQNTIRVPGKSRLSAPPLSVASPF